MPPLTARQRAALTVALSLAVFMNVLDLSIANVAIPDMAGELGTSADQGTWVITSFAVSAAIAMPLTGWLGRRFGEVRVFLVCTAMFTLASFLCGLASNLAMLIAMRTFAGVFAGPMIPLSQSLLLNNYPEDRKSLALGLLMMVTIVAPVLGPVLGGWITDNWNWAWIFYINVPVGIVATLLAAGLLRDRETPTSRPPVDFVGIGLLALGIGSLQVLLDRGKDLDWFGSGTIVALGVIALVALAFFVAWELTAEQPAVDLTLFARRNFTAGTPPCASGSSPISATSCCCHSGCRPRWATPRPGPGSPPRPSASCPSRSSCSSRAIQGGSTCAGSARPASARSASRRSGSRASTPR